MIGLTHLINQYFNLALEIYTDERIVQPDAHTKGSFNIETQLKPYRKHQPQNSYSEKFTYIPQAFLVTYNWVLFNPLKISYSIHPYNYKYSKSFQTHSSKMILTSEYKQQV